MTNLIPLATGKLDDPILMDWALDRYRDARIGDPGRRQAMEQAWFDDLTLRRWLDSDDQEILARLFLELPAERFANLAQAIGERWGHWGGPLAHRAAPVLARHAPDPAWRCFAKPDGNRHRDAYAVLGIVGALPLLPSETGRGLIAAIAEETRTTGRHSLERDMVVDALIAVGLQVDRPLARGLIRERLREADGERALDLTLDQVSTGLFGYSPYDKLASDLRQGRSKQSFQALAALFRADAPLERLDQWSRGEVALADLNGPLEAFIADKDRQVILDVIETLKAKGLGRHWGRVADFLIGSLAAACERPELDTSAMGLPDLVALLSADLSPSPRFETLVAPLETLEPAAVTAALIDALERERDTYGGVTIARVMGRLGWEAFVPVLTGSMSDDSGDLLCEEARDALIAIGGPARDHLIARWGELDVAQQIYGLSALVAMGGEPVASFALDPGHDLFLEDPESWCRLAAAAPDPRLVDRLERELARRQRHFDETFYQAARLLDLDHPQLRAVGERVRNRRAEQQTRRAAFARGEWFHDTLTLTLRCPDCGAANEYKVRRVAIDPGDPGSEPLLAQELACASCGQWSDLAFTAEARLTLTAELLKHAADGRVGRAGENKVLTRPLVPLNGRMRPVTEVVAHCRAAVTQNPDSIGDWVRLAYCYQQVLSRARFGVRFSDQALSLDPNAVEAVILKADTLALEADAAAAFERLDQALASKDQWRYFLTDVSPPAQIAAQFAQHYNRLLHRLGRSDRAALHASFLGTSKKVGRNDPCPCGSGKKYKKCCLRGP
jgi:hypothetical protein